ncbi:hypothetical protein M404DRAFT_1004489 [Pisolithus tinctorius Marx 270]|uniref:Uncharacterized protein n=1 Tax=Pisolithus tinctorius Marx 270 TaxID=870435 RepID=A0A0C3NWN5_PISTI|nr:hypothetical protein M404DRAFT_1004489 [Pisolithus tinctorius Marx 270]
MTAVGLMRRDVTLHQAGGPVSRAFVYDLRNFARRMCLDRSCWERPCPKAGSVWALVNVYAMMWIGMEKEEAGDHNNRNFDTHEAEQGRRQRHRRYTTHVAEGDLALIDPEEATNMQNADRERL